MNNAAARSLPARTQSLIAWAAEIIPRIFRIMKLPRARLHGAGGWPRPVRAGLRPGPPLLTGVSAEAAGVKGDFACTFSGHLVLCSLP